MKQFQTVEKSIQAYCQVPEILVLPHLACSAIVLIHQETNAETRLGCLTPKLRPAHLVGMRGLSRPALATFSLLLSTTNAGEPNSWGYYKHRVIIFRGTKLAV